MVFSLRLCCALAAMIGATAIASANVLHDESVHGPLSNDRFNPTLLPVPQLGSNLVRATTQAGDREYYTLIVPTGASLSAIMLNQYVSNDPLSFIAVQAGPVFTEPPTGTNVANLLGWTHFGDAWLGTDLLSELGMGAGAIGFSGPLGPGTYTFWAQQTGPSPTLYEMDFVLVPAPGAAAAFALGALACARRRGR